MDTNIHFTKLSVAKLACPPGRAEMLFWDRGLPGFGVRCFASGTRRYVVQYRTGDGVQRRERLGDPRTVKLEDAKERAREKLARAQLGGDPQAERKAAREAVHLCELVEAYLAAAGKRLRPRSFAETKRHLEGHAKPLHGRPAYSISRQDIAELLAGIAERSGAVTANRVRSSLSAMWTWAVMEGRQEQNPVAATRKPAREASRERVLSDAELAAIWRATAAGADHDRIIRLLVLTGVRRDEAGRMQWAELAGDLWTIPGARTKNGLPHEVSLPVLAMAQLPKRDGARQAVFGKGDTGFSGWSRCKARLDGRISDRVAEEFRAQQGRAPIAEKGEARLVPWTVHDLRRTVATWLSEHGETPHVVEAVLNHVSGAAKRGVAGVYNKASYHGQKQAALARWAQHVAELIGDDTSNVATLGQR